jgi:hypothetical protein
MLMPLRYSTFGGFLHHDFSLYRASAYPMGLWHGRSLHGETGSVTRLVITPIAKQTVNNFVHLALYSIHLTKLPQYLYTCFPPL